MKDFEQVNGQESSAYVPAEWYYGLKHDLPSSVLARERVRFLVPGRSSPALRVSCTTQLHRSHTESGLGCLVDSLIVLTLVSNPEYYVTPMPGDRPCAHT